MICTIYVQSTLGGRITWELGFEAGPENVDAIILVIGPTERMWSLVGRFNERMKVI